VDGDANGTYHSLDTIVSFVDPEFENPDGHWYSGETSKEGKINESLPVLRIMKFT
jgi:hypothetical protein